MTDQCEFNETQTMPAIFTCSTTFNAAKIDHVTMFNCSSEGMFFIKVFHSFPSLLNSSFFPIVAGENVSPPHPYIRNLTNVDKKKPLICILMVK